MIITAVRSRREARAFVHLPADLHAASLHWVPPLLRDERRILDRRRNLAYRYCDTVFALAFDGARPVGRIAGIINHRYNAAAAKAVARFGFFECTDDYATVEGLLSHVERWAAARGVRRVVGPMGFTDQDPEGLLVEGFDEEPSIGSYMNCDYLPVLIERAGYVKEVDYMVYSVPVNHEQPELYKRIFRRLAKGRHQLLEFTDRQSLKPFVKPILALMNETFRDLYGFVPLDDLEMAHLAREYLPMIDPRFVKLASRDGRIDGFILGIPNMNVGFRRARGRLWPFGVFKIRAAAAVSDRLDLLLGAIRPECRGVGLDVVLGNAMLSSARQAGMRTIDSHHELESNYKMRHEMERVGGRVYKRFRIYSKDLSPERIP